MTGIAAPGVPISTRGVVVDHWYDYFFPGGQAAGYTAQIASTSGVLGPVAWQSGGVGATFTLQDGIGGGPIIFQATFNSGFLLLPEFAVLYQTGLFFSLTVATAALIFVAHRE